MKRAVSRYIWLSALAVALIAAGAAMLVASRDGAPREIRLVARDMTFYIEGQDEPNPPLTLRAGERVRVVLRNEDAGMSHDFVIKALNVGTPLLDGKGQQAIVEFRAPEKKGTHEYTCTPHAAMMKGTIAIE